MRIGRRYISSADGCIVISELYRTHSVDKYGAPMHDEPQTEFRCMYCGTVVPDGCPDPSMFSCCGEVGHVEEVVVE